MSKEILFEDRARAKVMEGVDALANAGITAIVEPGGSIRDDEVVTAAQEHDVAIMFTHRRHFRH